MSEDQRREIVLLAAARQAIIEMEPDHQRKLAADLRNLEAFETSAIEVDPTRPEYRAALLPSGSMVVYRELQPDELAKLAQDRVIDADSKGYAVFDLIPSESVGRAPQHEVQ